MLRKALWVVLALCVLQLLNLGIGHAQDFGSLVRQATTTNRQWLAAIDSASQATDLATLKREAATAQALGEQTRSLLQQALPLAPDDAARSRISGVLAHVNAAVKAAKRVATATTLDAARSDLNAERGEVNETKSELVPFAQGLSPARAGSSAPSSTTAAAASAPRPATTGPATLPRTGGIPLSDVGAVGGLLLLAGAAVRRRAA